MLHAPVYANVNTVDWQKTSTVHAESEQVSKPKVRVFDKSVGSKTQVSQRNVDDLYIIIMQDQSLVTFAQQQQTLQLNRVAKPKKLNLKSASTQGYLTALEASKGKVINDLSMQLNRQLKVENNFKYSINAFTARISADDLAKVRAHQGVKSVVKVTPRKLTTFSGPQHVNADKVWSGIATGVEYKGEGVIVGILDTGVNPHHQSFAAIGQDNYQHNNPLANGEYLGDCAQAEYKELCNDKLIGIWSHPEITNQSDTPDIGIDFDGHGSHVASTAAGNVLKNIKPNNVLGDVSNAVFEQVSGVAPHANVVSYQVCDLYSCWPDIALAAVDHAIEHGIDVLNYSIGSPVSNSPWDSFNFDAQAMLNARAAGIHVAVSAGNEGNNGIGDNETILAPANAPWLTSVAAVDHGGTLSNEKTISFSPASSVVENISGLSATKGIEAEIVDGKDFGNGDCLSPFAENTLTNKIVICRRGDIPRVEKGSNALAGNAAGMILINVAGGDESLNGDLHQLPTVHVDYVDGEKILNWLSSGADQYRVSFIDSQLTIDNDFKNQLAGFSSIGPEPLFESYLAPTVAAPGVQIYAADKNTNDSIIQLSGTSMASPHVAGALALIAGLKPEWTPAQAQSALMLTADEGIFRLVLNEVTNQYSKQATTVFDRGTGAIVIDRALNAPLTMDESIENYIDADPSNNGKPQQLNLPALVAKDCLIECTWQRTFTAANNSQFNLSIDSEDGLLVTATPTQFSLSAGETVSIEFSAKIDSNYQGGYQASTITIDNNDNFSSLSLPVMASFKRGKYPQDIEIIANSNIGSENIENVVTVGVDHIEVTPFALSKINHTQFQLQRDDSDFSNFPYNVINDEGSFYSVPFGISWKSRFFSAKIISTTSPDIDLYVAFDANLNGKVDAYEFSELLCESANYGSDEACVIDYPAYGNYVLLVHNYGDYDTATGDLDDVEIEFYSISPNNGMVNAYVNSDIQDLQDIGLSISWDADMEKGSQYITAIDLASATDTSEDIAYIPVRLKRSFQSMSVYNTASTIGGEVLTLTINVDGNDTDSAQLYDIHIDLPESLNLLTSSHNAEFANGKLNLSLELPANSDAQTVTIDLNTNAVTYDEMIDLSLTYRLDTGNEQTLNFSTISIKGKPVALINDSESFFRTAVEGSQITLSGLASFNPSTVSNLTYQWRQISGPNLSIASNNSELQLNLPEVNADETVVIELTVYQNGVESVATATIDIENKKSSSGGGNLFWLLIIISFGLAQKRQICFRKLR